MNILVALLAVVPAVDDQTKPPSAEVNGNIATRVAFKRADADKVAEASLSLLASCHHVNDPVGGQLPEWDDTRLKTFNTRSYLHIRFSKPQVVKFPGGKAVAVTEMLIALPLNNGGLWVRVGDRAQAFGKYEHAKCVALQRLLKQAEPVD